MQLSDILEIVDDPTQPRWMECPEAPGFAILVRLPDVPGIRGLAMQASYENLERIKKAAAEAKPGDLLDEEMDPAAVGIKWAHYAIRDWRGLTRERLKFFLEGVQGLKIKAPAAEEGGDELAPWREEIPFQRELLEVLLRHSVRFYEFVDQAWKQRQAGDLEVRQADEKNSLSAPASTPTPRGVPGARKTSKGLRRRSSATSAKDPSGEPPTS